MEKDLTRPFYHQYREGDKLIIELNTPNDQVGDFAFEWDEDGSERKAWEEHVKDLEEKGIRGRLELKTMVLMYNPAFDGDLPYNYDKFRYLDEF